MDTDYDVVVVGAGPAGISAAIEAHERGLRVCVIDKATFPRSKTCGDGLTTAALRHLQRLGLDPADVASWTPVRHAIWRSPSGHETSLDVPNNKGLRIAVAERSDLDAALVRLAISKGVEIRQDTALISAEATENWVRIDTSNGQLHCKFAIGADGIYSPLRKALNPEGPKYLGDIHAFRQYMTNATGPAADKLWVSFDKDILPGYIWAFPLGNGRVNFGFGVERSVNRTVQWMKHTWDDILDRPHVRQALGPDAVGESVHRAWPIPTKIYNGTLSSGDRVLFVGDAARSVDPLTGEGIAQALETGNLAGRAIAQSLNEPGSAVRTYEREIRRGMRHDHKFSTLLANVVRHEAGARLAIRMAPLGPQRGRYAMRWVFEDNPRAALITPWRWPQRFAEKPFVYADQLSNT